VFAINQFGWGLIASITEIPRALNVSSRFCMDMRLKICRCAFLYCVYVQAAEYEHGIVIEIGTILGHPFKCFKENVHTKMRLVFPEK